ncbi:MAG TPA: hypothetical protein DEB40_05465 [Elusimicrobia bacterium]|nr:hypothetical protein [Elusimicrobiota bacterium]HBT61173.1 hypothetical protein [Elusimicrobiota bacterium]
MAVLLGAFCWRGTAARDATWGLGCAWLFSTISTVWLVFAKPVSSQSFWRAFWGGMGLRASVLIGLMALSWDSARVALVGAYGAGMALLLPLEFWLVFRR